jgi:hypothetical protein
MILLAAAFSFYPLITSLVLAQDKQTRFDWGLVAASMAVMIFAFGVAFWTVRDIPRAAPAVIVRPTELEHIIQILWFDVNAIVAIVTTGIWIMLWCLWKMAYLSWRYYRWSLTAKRSALQNTTAVSLARLETQSRPTAQL